MDDKDEASSDPSSDKDEGLGGSKVLEDNLWGTVQRVRIAYLDALARSPPEDASTLTAGLTPSLPSETPVLRPPPNTAIILQEENPESGGVADQYRGTVGSAGRDADAIERTAPLWLGDALLRNEVPAKEIVKVSFVLQPYGDLLPGIASPDGNARLNANRMLRAKKVVAYVTERIDPDGFHDPEHMRPEEYVDIYCQNQVSFSLTIDIELRQGWCIETLWLTSMVLVDTAQHDACHDTRARLEDERRRGAPVQGQRTEARAGAAMGGAQGSEGSDGRGAWRVSRNQRRRSRGVRFRIYG